MYVAKYSLILSPTNYIWIDFKKSTTSFFLKEYIIKYVFSSVPSKIYGWAPAQLWLFLKPLADIVCPLSIYTFIHRKRLPFVQWNISSHNRLSSPRIPSPVGLCVIMSEMPEWFVKWFSLYTTTISIYQIPEDKRFNWWYIFDSAISTWFSVKVTPFRTAT